uniref:Murine leukemia virus integrase C-terminal domain-containing protein n=1 Tax=Nothoprocta perdicaria TaxID=30464 RepID=A0A8C6YPZ8_NOTPE
KETPQPLWAACSSALSPSQFRTASWEPRWTAPHIVILCTPTAVKIAGKPAWIHHSHVKTAPSQPDSGSDKWTIVKNSDNLLKITLRKGKDVDMVDDAIHRDNSLQRN